MRVNPRLQRVSGGRVVLVTASKASHQDVNRMRPVDLQLKVFIRMGSNLRICLQDAAVRGY